MIDINTPLLKAYYNALSGLPYSVYEGEEPDDITDQCYIVISDVTNTDISTKSSTDLNSSIQISIHTWEEKYNTSLTANTAANLIFAIINPTPKSTLTATGIGIATTKLTTDRTERVVELAGRKYVSRILVYSHYIYTT